MLSLSMSFGQLAKQISEQLTKKKLSPFKTSPWKPLFLFPIWSIGPKKDFQRAWKYEGLLIKSPKELSEKVSKAGKM